MTAETIEAVRAEVAESEKRLAAAMGEYNRHVAAGDLDRAAAAKQQADQSREQRDTLNDRVAALEAQQEAEAQRAADKKLAQALKRAEAASKAERMAAAGLGEIVERLRTLKADLEDRGREAARATHAAYAAADAAGRPRPDTGRSILKADATTTEARRLVGEIGRMLDMQESTVVAATGERRKAG